MAARKRLDTLLVERGLFESRSKASASVIAGEVRLGRGRERAAKPGMLVADEVELEVAGGSPYVSRGGLKLQRALASFGSRRQGGCASTWEPRPGASRTACCMAAPPVWWRRRRLRGARLGAARGSARDVASNVSTLAPCNLRRCPIAPDLIVMDLSFISLAKVLPAVAAAPRRAATRSRSSSRSSSSGRGRVGRGSGPQTRGSARGDGEPRGRRLACRAAVRGYALRACPARRGTARASSGAPRHARGSATRDLQHRRPRDGLEGATP